MSEAFVISDNDSVSTRVRQVLAYAAYECTAAHLVPLEGAVNRLAAARAERAVLVLSPDPERALAVLAQLRDRTACRVVAVGPPGDTKLVLRTLRGGAEDYVEEPELETELPAVLARFQTEVAAPGEAGRVIAVLAPSGGSGSSTLAVNVATVLAKEHKTAALVDLKLGVGDLSALLDLKPNHSLADLCQNVQRMDRVMFDRSLARHESGVHLLAAPRTFGDLDFVTAEGVRQALGLAQTAFPYVVIDLDHSFHEEQVQALRMADVILLVIRLDFASLRNAQRTLDLLGQLGIERERVRLVVNRFGQPKEVPAAKAEEALRVKIFHLVPDDPKTVNRANNNGVPVVLDAPSAKVSKSVTRLAISINGRHKEH